MLNKVLNLALRGFSIGVRFLFVFYISKNFTLEFLGNYSLWNTTITLSLLLVGLDFYIFSNRELLASSKQQQFSLIRNQFVFIIISYFVFVPLSFLIFQFNILPPDLFIYFIGVLIMEHLGMEIYRLNIALEKPIFSNLLLLIRNSIWVVAIVIYWFIIDVNEPKIQHILIFWIAFALISNTIGIFVLIKRFKNEKLNKIDWKWISKGLSISSKLFLATIALKTIELSDRYMIDYFLGKTQLGIFSFYFQLSNLINVLIFTAVIMISYPKMFKDIFDKNENYKNIKKTMLKQTLIIWISISIILILLINPIISFLNKPQMAENIEVIYFLLIGTLFFNIYTLNKLVLNAFKKDNELIFITLIAAIINFTLNFLYLNDFGIITAAVSSLLSYVFLSICTLYIERNSRGKLLKI